MPRGSINDVELHYEIEGSGPPLVLVHGSWDTHAVWGQAAERLAERFRVISYDRRSHGQSERPPGPRNRREDEADLAAMITEVAGEPAYVAANSFGGVISLGLLERRPELVRALAIHEPPALTAADGGELAERAQEVQTVLEEVLAEIEAGAEERATRRFIEDVALGPGAWQLTPPEFRAALVANAPAFLAEQRDPNALALDFDAVRACDVPLLVTKGEASPAWLVQLAARVAKILPTADTATIPGAGHVPHETHPGVYVKEIEEFFAGRLTIAA